MSVLGAIGIGASLLSGLLNTGASIFNTKKTVQANKNMAEYSYNKDLELYHLNNAYNAPSAQMNRLAEAGLNPNLVYGTGAVGNTSGSTPKYGTPNLEYDYKADLDIVPSLAAYQDFSVKKAQTDNLHAQNDLITQQAITEGLRSAKLGVDTARTEFDLNLAKKLENTSLQAAETNLRNIQLDSQLKKESLKLTPLERRKLEQAIKLGDFDINLRSKGITSSDSLLIRSAVQNYPELFTFFKNLFHTPTKGRGKNSRLNIFRDM